MPLPARRRGIIRAVVPLATGGRCVIVAVVPLAPGGRGIFGAIVPLIAPGGGGIGLLAAWALAGLVLPLLQRGDLVALFIDHQRRIVYRLKSLCEHTHLMHL